MLAINLCYLYLLGSLTLRLRRVVIVGAACAAPESSTAVVAAIERFWRLLGCWEACEALRLPFWDSCIAFLASRAAFWRSFLASLVALSFSLTSLSLSCLTRFSWVTWSLYRRAFSLSLDLWAFWSCSLSFWRSFTALRCRASRNFLGD
jgi:hypothetical protein